MMPDRLFIIGSGGHTRSVISLLRDQKYEIDGIYDDSYKTGEEEIINSIRLRGKISDCQSLNNLVLSVGDNAKRLKLYRKFNNKIYRKSIIHSKSFLDATVKLGLSNLIFGNVFINANVKIGDNNILNTGCIIEHESVIGSNNHISVGAILCGRTNIGDHCFLGAGSVINDSVSICNNVVIGSNSTVIKSIKKPGVYVGQPARKIDNG